MTRHWRFSGADGVCRGESAVSHIARLRKTESCEFMQALEGALGIAVSAPQWRATAKPLPHILRKHL